MLAVFLGLGGCKSLTLVTRWPGEQVPATDSYIRYLDVGLPRPGTVEPAPAVAAAPAGPVESPVPQAQPTPNQPAVVAAPLGAVSVQTLPGAPPPTSPGSVTVDPSALPPRPGDPLAATLMGQSGAAPSSVAALPPPTVSAPPGQKTVALLLPLSGQAAGLGQAMQEAAMLAAYDMGSDDLMLRFYNSTGTPEGAAAAARQAIADGAQMILGPLFGAEAREVGPVAAQAGVGVLAFSNDRSVAGPGLNILGFLPEAQVIRVVAYARSKQIERFAVIAPANDYGNAVVNSLRLALDAYGGQLTEVAIFDPAIEDQTPTIRTLAKYDSRRRAQIQQLQGKNDTASKAALRQLQDQISSEMNFDAVLIAESGPRLRAMAPLLPYYDIDPAKIRFLGTAQWDEPGLGTEPALVGAWFAAASPDARAAFDKRYEQVFKRKPPRLASLAYDAAALAAVVARGRGFSADALRQPSGYAGVDGIFRLRPDGLVDRGLAVLEVLPRGVKVIDPPPESFEGMN